MFYIGQLLIGLFFIATGFVNIKGWQKNVDRMSNTILPLPKLCLILAILMQFIGGILLVINWQIIIGALLCILFTTLSSAFFMRFWQTGDPKMRHIQFLFFIEHIAVIGALLMIMAR